MSEPNCGIYKITNLITGDFYIGQSTNLDKRKTYHWSPLKTNTHINKHLQRAWNKYGEENFKFETIIYCEPFELTRYEQALVDKWKPHYNIRKECVDSNRGLTYSDEHKRKISETLMGHSVSEETRVKISEKNKGKSPPNKGIPMSNEQKEKLEKYRKENPITDEVRKKISDSQKGRIQTEETRKKISEAGLGRIFSEETKRKIGAKNSARMKEFWRKKKLNGGLDV